MRSHWHQKMSDYYWTFAEKVADKSLLPGQELQDALRESFVDKVCNDPNFRYMMLMIAAGKDPNPKFTRELIRKYLLIEVADSSYVNAQKYVDRQFKYMLIAKEADLDYNMPDSGQEMVLRLATYLRAIELFVDMLVEDFILKRQLEESYGQSEISE